MRIATIAHAGDGNPHPMIRTPAGDDAARVVAQAMQRAVEQRLDPLDMFNPGKVVCDPEE